MEQPEKITKPVMDVAPPAPRVASVPQSATVKAASGSTPPSPPPPSSSNIAPAKPLVASQSSPIAEPKPAAAPPQPAAQPSLVAQPGHAGAPMPPPPDESDDASAEPPANPETLPEVPELLPVAHKPKQPHDSPIGAIVITVLIMIALSALAVLVYLNS